MTYPLTKPVLLAAAVLLMTHNEAMSDALEVTVRSSADDAEQSLATGVMVGNASSDLEIGVEIPGLSPSAQRGAQYIGLRFRELSIPAGSTIDSAMIQFAVDEPDKSRARADFAIWGELSPDPSAFRSGSGNISNRPRTSNVAHWLDVPPWRKEFARTADQATSDLAAVVQEIVDQPDWEAGNAMAFVIAPYSVVTADIDGASQANRTAVSFDRSASDAPALMIDFTPMMIDMGLAGDCDDNGQLDANDLSCVTTISERDAVLTSLSTLPGDLDGDGEVAFPDFLTLADHFGRIPATYAEGNIDLEDDGVAFPDFLELANNFGEKSNDVASVPEPSSFRLAIFAIVGFTSFRRKRYGCCVALALGGERTT